MNFPLTKEILNGKLHFLCSVSLTRRRQKSIRYRKTNTQNSYINSRKIYSFFIPRSDALCVDSCFRLYHQLVTDADTGKFEDDD